MTAAPRSPRRRTALAALTVAASLTLAGCGAGVQPGAAAVVGSDTISHAQVDDVASTYCSVTVRAAEAVGQQAPPEPTRDARRTALQLLLETEIAQQFGEEHGVRPDPQEVSLYMERQRAGLALLPPEERAELAQVLEDYAEGQSMIAEAGRRALQASGLEDPPLERALEEGYRLREQFVSDLDVEVDPRYGSFTEQGLQPGDSSLSVPESDRALEAAAATAPPGWAADLPASQRCS